MSEGSLNTGKKHWTTLEHNGFVFNLDYTPLPRDIALLVNGRPVQLDSKIDFSTPLRMASEEAVVLFARALKIKRNNHKPGDKDLLQDDVFVENFLRGWRSIGKDTKYIPKTASEARKTLNFDRIVDHLNLQDEIRKGRPVQEKEAEERRKAEEKERYGYVTVDGERMPVMYIVEPPNVFLGKGTQKNRGMLKARVIPEDVTVNCSGAPPPPPRGHKWGSVVTNKKSVWAGKWKDSVTGALKYMYPSRAENVYVHDADREKFEKARYLAKNIETLRRLYMADLRGSDMTKKYLALAVYFLDKIAIRPDSDDDKDNDTVGLTTLRCSNVKFKANSVLEIDFKGKSSIVYKKDILVEEVVYTALRDRCRAESAKQPDPLLFNGISSDVLNNYIKTLVDGVTAKVFRTLLASSTLEAELSVTSRGLRVESTDDEKKLALTQAFVKVADVMNHKKMTDNEAKVEKLRAQLEAEKDAKKKLKIQMKLESEEKNISVGTSKANYIDPRVCVSWAKRYEFPIEKVYAKNDLKKFTWAMSEMSSWRY